MIKTLVVGMGQMGKSHALAHHKHPNSTIIGLVNRSKPKLPDELSDYPIFSTFEEGLAAGPDLVVIATYTDTHADFAIRAMEAGAHVFVEKPLALTAEAAEEVVNAARRTGAFTRS